MANQSIDQSPIKRVVQVDTNGDPFYDNGWSYSNKTADALIKTGPGVVHTITFAQLDAAPTAGSIILYDNTAESGNIIFTHTQTTAVFMPVTITLDATFNTGLYLGFTTTADVSVTVTYR